MGVEPTTHDILLQRIDELEADNKVLRRRLYEGREEPYRAPPQLRFTKYEERIIGMLMTGKRFNSDALIMGLYHDQPDGGPTYANNTLKAFISKMNAKMRPFDIQIQCEYSLGYHLTAHSIEVINEL